MSDNLHHGPLTPESGSGLPNWLPPLSAVRGPAALVMTGSCVFALSLIYLLDVSTPPGTSLGAAAIIPVLAAAWTLSDRLAILVTALALGFRLAAGLGGAVPGLEAMTDGF